MRALIMRSSSTLLSPTALALGLATAHCGPPVATQPAPTPVYAEDLTVPPVEVLHESLDEDEGAGSEASLEDASAEENGAKQPDDHTRPEEAPAESVPEPVRPEPDASESSGAPRDVAAPAVP